MEEKHLIVVRDTQVEYCLTGLFSFYIPTAVCEFLPMDTVKAHDPKQKSTIEHDVVKGRKFNSITLFGDFWSIIDIKLIGDNSGAIVHQFDATTSIMEYDPRKGATVEIVYCQMTPTAFIQHVLYDFLNESILPDLPRIESHHCTLTHVDNLVLGINHPSKDPFFNGLMASGTDTPANVHRTLSYILDGSISLYSITSRGDRVVKERKGGCITM